MANIKTVNELIEFGMISIPAAIYLDIRLSYRAIGCYTTMIAKLSERGTIDTKDLVTDNISIDMNTLALQELLAYGWIELDRETKTYTVNTLSTKPTVINKFSVQALEETAIQRKELSTLEEDTMSLKEHMNNLSLKVESDKVRTLLGDYNYEAIKHSIGLITIKFSKADITNESFIPMMKSELEILGSMALKGNKFAPDFSHL